MGKQKLEQFYTSSTNYLIFAANKLVTQLQQKHHIEFKIGLTKIEAK